MNEVGCCPLAPSEGYSLCIYVRKDPLDDIYIKEDREPTCNFMKA